VNGSHAKEWSTLSWTPTYGLFVLFPLSCPAAPPALQRGLRRWAAAWLPRARGTRSGVGFTPLLERGSAGALREEGRGDQVVGAWADYNIRLTRLHVSN
jgi:hypothetical protein